MKTNIFGLKPLLLFLFFAFAVGASNAQDLKTALQNRHFVFDVQTVVPTGASVRQVGGQGYTLRLSADSLTSYLPYFGRAYSAPIDNTNSSNLTATAFDYDLKARKKGGWNITIKPKDNSDYREFALTVSDNGFAALRVQSNNRQPISYNGQVSALE